MSKPTPASLLRGLGAHELEAFVSLAHPDPHGVLGAHPSGDGAWVVRAWHPDAAGASCLPPGNRPPVAMTRVHPAGLWAARVEGLAPGAHCDFRFTFANGVTLRVTDPYSFGPTWGPVDEHLAAEGRHWSLHDRLGAHVRTVEGVAGTAFAVWAPHARRVSVVGTMNHWDGRRHPMRRLGATGVWELFLPSVEPGARYKFEVGTAEGAVLLKLDPFAQQTELRPGTSGVVAAPSKHAWRDAAWMASRARRSPLHEPMSIYEVHLGSWMRGPQGRWLTWAELADKLGAYVAELGFTHVELLPVSEHPFDGSWGYQVTGHFAPTARFGEPDGLRVFVDRMHELGVGVIVDWVPAHFPKDAHALARFDGTALYEHEDPRQGEHPDWGTMVFNFGRTEVKNFLLVSALAWLERFHVDGLRVDAVASMLYLDYSRREGEWVPNAHGGRENLDAIAFLRELNGLVHGRHPGAMVIAEESTSWPAVSRPVYAGGLGFTFKWNMGWMHDTLAYFARDPVHRRYHHNELTFGIVYAWSENFVLPLSHDEVVHLKRSLLGKMPGDEWQRFANLRLLYAYMWAHPGKKLLFMGAELAAWREWDHDGELDWRLLEDPMHRGVQRLVHDLNAALRAHRALWEADADPSGFRWIDANDTEQSVASFVRSDRAGRSHMVCVLNATPVPRHGYRIGVPREGAWREVLNSDAHDYGGSGTGNFGGALAEPIPSHGFPASMVVTLPPLGAVWFASPDEPAAAPEAPAP
ncbi:MAG: 1,4-alpha-glucan branching protein GlgB [Polyangiales bacterium]